MKITKIQTFVLRWPEPNDFNHDRMTVLVRVDTKGGPSGWGEAIAMWPEACRATVAIIEEGFAPHPHRSGSWMSQRAGRR